ncbi:energy-coupling factor transporter transmembrane component T [Limosilactobacillus equigenerosi]|uniref:energy-coupling factor transporter transmembrane component T n=1 Tax=Limosilactobacillus equigenerosi TaxID=417373 RepID=UPI0009E86E54
MARFFIALRQLRVPTVIVTTLDIMIKYTYTLGSYLLEVLNSIQLRSIGQPVDRKMVGNIIGKLYLSAKQRSVEVYQAMLMRGYYQPALVRQKYKFNRYDGWELLQLVVVIMVFIFSRG